MSIKYSPNILTHGHTPAPQGFGDAQWHVDATQDTGTSHTIPGRLHIVQCEWCPAAFAADTKREAMSMFRHHELERLRAYDVHGPSAAPVQP